MKKSYSLPELKEKLKNTAGFILSAFGIEKCRLPENPPLEDKWILSRYSSVVKSFVENPDSDTALRGLYSFIGYEFCSFYIDFTKPRLYGENVQSSLDAQYTLCYILQGISKLLPALSAEEIFPQLPFCEEAGDIFFPEEERIMEAICRVIEGVRSIRTEMNTPLARRTDIIILTEDKDIFKRGIIFYEKFAAAKNVIITSCREEIPESTAPIAIENATVFIPLDGLIDTEKERERLLREKESLEAELARMEEIFANKAFTDKAPKSLVEEEREKGIRYREMYQKVLDSLSRLN